MFGKKKQLKEIEDKLQRIEKEKEELLKIKEMLDDQSPKIDISDLYVWEDKKNYYIVNKKERPITGRCMGGKGPRCNGMESTLIDIFTNKVIYNKSSVNPIMNHELIKVTDDFVFGNQDYYARLYPIYEISKTLLAYPDKKVPLYVLQQFYYELNNIDITKIKVKFQDK